MGVCKLRIASLMFHPNSLRWTHFHYEKCLFLFVVELVLLVSLLLRESLFPWLCSLRAIRSVHWRFDLLFKSLQRIIADGSRRVLSVPYLLSGILLSPIAWIDEHAHLYFLHFVEWVSSELVTWNLGSWLTCVDCYRGRHVVNMTIVCSSTPLCVLSTNVDDRGQASRPNSQVIYYAPRVYYHPFPNGMGGLSGASCAHDCCLWVGISCLLCCLLLISWQLIVMF